MAHLQPVLLALPAMQHMRKISKHHPIHILIAARKLLDANAAHGHGMCTQSSSTSRTLKPHLHSSSHASRLDLEKGRSCIPSLWKHHHHCHLRLSMLLLNKILHLRKRIHSRTASLSGKKQSCQHSTPYFLATRSMEYRERKRATASISGKHTPTSIDWCNPLLRPFEACFAAGSCEFLMFVKNTCCSCKP
jgi:hypothetical protein